MKTWTKPAAASTDAGFEVTRYLPSALDIAAKRECSGMRSNSPERGSASE